VNLSNVFLVQLPNFFLSFSLLFQWLQLLLVFIIIIIIIINLVIIFTPIISLHVICSDSPLRQMPFSSSLHAHTTV
jgi:hypothetical protein